jgi:hypothetical protein
VPRSDYKRCRFCGRHADEVGELSHTRLCGDCAVVLLSENALGLHFKQGPAYTHYARRWFMAARRTLLDAEQTAP